MEWDCETGVVKYNPKKIETLGYKPGEINPNVYEWTEMIHPHDYENTMNAMREHLQGNLPAYEVEYRIKHKNGSYRWFYDRGNIVERNPDGSPARLIGIVFDITERKLQEEEIIKAKARLEELNATKDKFFSIIAHDLRNPFNYVLGTTDFLYNNLEAIQNNRLKDFMKELNNSAKLVFSLLENLLHWSRTQTGRIELKPQNFVLVELVVNNIYLNKQNAETKKINISYDVPKDITVYADYNMVNTVLRNLISNAVKYSNEGGDVSISSNKTESEVIVTVRDTGIGMTESEIESLFQIGTISKQGTSKEQGTGLGLILCKEFVNLNGGKISVESKQGKGSGFIFTLPKAK